MNTTLPTSFFCKIALTRLHVYSSILVFVLLLVLLCPRVAFGQHELLLGVDPQSGIQIKAKSPLSAHDGSGYVPIQISIDNHSGLSQEWQANLTSQYFSSLSPIESVHQSTLRVANGEKRVFELVAPLFNSSFTKSYPPSLNLNLDGYGIVSGNASFPPDYPSYGMSSTSFIGFGSKYAAGNWERLKNELNAEKIELRGALIDTTALGSDWRGLTGFPHILLSEEEWRVLSAAQLETFRKWVAQGGNLILIGSEQVDLRNFGAKYQNLLKGHLDRSAFRYALGSVTLLNRGGFSIDIEDLRELKPSSASSMSASVNEYAKDAAHLEELVAPVSHGAGFIILFLLIYACAVGPINIFFLARKENRLELFLTTPLIALCASGVLSLYIFLRDGVGGSGVRSVTVLILPDHKNVLTRQMQIARTGLLFERTFELEDQTLAQPLALSDSSLLAGARYESFGTLAAGDWFQSRSRQAQFFQRITAAKRQRIEVINAKAVRSGAVPELSSTIPNILSELYLVTNVNDHDRPRYWRATNLLAGERRELTEVDKKSYLRLHRDLSEHLPQHLWDPIEVTARSVLPYGDLPLARSAELEPATTADHVHEAFFVARLDSAESMTLETLPGIVWVTDAVVYVGLIEL